MVVDVGCGTGALAGFLKEVGLEERRIVGVDMASEVGNHLDCSSINIHVLKHNL